MAGVSYLPDANSHATLWNGTTPTDLGTLGGTNSVANAINENGQIVGNSLLTGNAAVHAALWNGTSLTDLNSFLDASTSADWVLRSANGINDNGWIVGDAVNVNSGVTHAFLLTPVPEPETYAMLLAGLGLIGAMAKRRGRRLLS